MLENPERLEERALIERLTTKGNRTGCKGAASELLVCADLLRKGWNVFRSVSPECPFDLIVTKGKIHFEVEVRTSSKGIGKRMGCAVHGQYDILAIVSGNEIEYRPELPLMEEMPYVRETKSKLMRQA